MRANFSNGEHLTDEELIRRVQAGDEQAFAALMSRYRPQLWKTIIAHSREHRDAEEILMDVWRAVWENISGLRHPERFRGWLHRIAYNACKRYYVGARHAADEIPYRSAELIEHIDRDAVARFREAELRDAVKEAVWQLPEQVRRVAVLYYLEGWRISEIHREVGLAMGTIKTKLRQARERLRPMFGVNPQGGGTMSYRPEAAAPRRPKIKVVGIGGGGANAVKHIIAAGVDGVEFYVVNTDLDALERCAAATRVQIGARTTNGLGSGANPEIGQQAAEEDREKLRGVVADADIVFVLAGMGGGTGTGAAPLVAALAREQGAHTVGVVTCPFRFEGRARAQQAEEGLKALREEANIVLVMPTQRVLDTMERTFKIREAFYLSDEMLLRDVESISAFYAGSGMTP